MTQIIGKRFSSFGRKEEYKVDLHSEFTDKAKNTSFIAQTSNDQIQSLSA